MSDAKVDIATKIKFSDVCRMLEKIKKASGARQKETALQKYLESFNTFSREFKAQHDECEHSFYPVLRCLVPGADNSRGSYGIQLTTMGKLYIKVLNLAPEGEDAKRLNQTDVVKGCSDYADVVYSVMQNRSRETSSSLTLADIHQLLDVLAENDRRKTEAELTKFIEVASALEQKWLIRIILKRLHIGLGEQKIFSLYHPQAKEFYSRTTDLKRVCECVESGESIDMTDTIQPLQYIRPMLCEPLDLSKVEDMLKQNVYYLETKMDGERFQIHLLDDTYKYISRNGKDFTGNFGTSVAEGNLTPLLSKCFTITVRNMILDGEMMVWDVENAGYRVKGENYDVKSLRRDGRFKPCFVAYDVLYLNGISHVDKPYAERVALLEKIVKEQRGVLMLCKRTKVKNAEHLINCFNEALEAKEEGVVIKATNCVYKPGVRIGGWYKIKPDYINGVIKEFDLIIIGGYYNKTRTYVDSYQLGIYVKTDESNANPLFYAVAKVGLGLSYAQRLKLNVTLRPHWNDVSKQARTAGEHPSCIEWGTSVPDVWIDPTKSMILQIKATELTETSSFRTTHTLRFPRIETVRDDKPWYECMTLDEFERYSKGHCGVAKVNKRNLTSADLQPNKKVKLVQNSKNNPYATVFKASEISKISDVCDGLQFCILSTTPGKPTLEQLKAMAIRYGGRIVENPSLDTKKCICIAGDITGRVRRLMATGRYNIVSLDWMIRSFGGDRFVANLAQPKPRDMISMTVDMAEEYKKYFDEFGDSYTDEVDVEELQTIMSRMVVKNISLVPDDELLEIDGTVFDTNDPIHMFRRLNGHFYSSNSDTLPNILIIAKLIFRSKGGSYIDRSQLNSFKKMVHIFIDRASMNPEEFNEWMHETFTKPKTRVKVLSYNWILDCDRENQILDQTGYLVFENFFD